MTEDMPTVDGARAEAERRWVPSEREHPTLNSHRNAFVAGAKWLAPTVAALEAEAASLDAKRAGLEDRIEALSSEVARLGAELDAAQHHLGYHLVDFRPGADDKATGDLAVDMAAYATRQRARADAAEAVIERVREVVETAEDLALHGAFINRDPYDMTANLRAALSDAAPQAVAAPEVSARLPRDVAEDWSSAEDAVYDTNDGREGAR